MNTLYDKMVSIVCLTYNQEKYIRKCLDSLLAQQCSFPYEIIVHDDASSDNTPSILEQYRERFPTKVVVIQEKENQLSINGCEGIRQIIHPYCTGKYLADCDGDDYWDDKFKLQKQVDYMENNPDCGLCYGKVRVLDNSTGMFYPETIGINVPTFTDLLYANSIPDLSVMYRKDIFDSYYENIKPQTHNWKMGDYPLWLYIFAESKAHFFDEVFGVYRVRNNSISHQQDIKSQIAFLHSRDEIVELFCLRYSIDNSPFMCRSEKEQIVLYSAAKAYKEGITAIRSMKYLGYRRIKYLIRFSFKALFQSIAKMSETH